MDEVARKSNNVTKLSQCDPSIRAKLAAIISDLEGKGYRPRIQDGFRSPEDQLKAFHSGHSKLKFGFHNIVRHGVPASFAVDLLDDDHPLQPSTKYLLLVAAIAEAHGLVTGIRWGLPTAMRKAIDIAIASKHWDAPIKVGWDPTHIQPTGVTPTQAQNGLYKP